jgi:hypothetical protein
VTQRPHAPPVLTLNLIHLFLPRETPLLQRNTTRPFDNVHQPVLGRELPALQERVAGVFGYAGHGATEGVRVGFIGFFLVQGEARKGGCVGWGAVGARNC